MKAISVQLKSLSWVQNQMAIATNVTPVNENANRRILIRPNRKGLPDLILSPNIIYYKAQDSSLNHLLFFIQYPRIDRWGSCCSAYNNSKLT